MISRTDLPHLALVQAEVQGASTTEELHRALALGATIPDRISAEPGTAYYSAEWSPRVEQVSCNGLPLRDVVEFDHRAGWVEQLLRDPLKPGHGLVVGGVVQTRRREGRVTVELRIPAGHGRAA